MPAGVHHESLNPKSGDTIYLEPGAFVFGSLNLWQVDNVKVLGRGTIVYDGPQDPNGDTGWLQKPDWHCIVADQAHNVEIDGLTCIIRSRTWSIQMKNSTGFRIDDLRVIGGDPSNANQDGMDWLGGGDTIVNHSFFRASDDDLAALGNWDGYTEAALRAPGADVNNILVENSEFSTSISNVVRLGWPQKTYNLHNFTLRDSDILHGGIGVMRSNVWPARLLGRERRRRRSLRSDVRESRSRQLVFAGADGAREAQPARIHVQEHLGARSAASSRVNNHRRCE